MGNWYEVLAFLEKFHILKNIDFIEFLFQQKVKDRAHTREVTGSNPVYAIYNF